MCKLWTHLIKINSSLQNFLEISLHRFFFKSRNFLKFQRFKLGASFDCFLPFFYLKETVGFVFRSLASCLDLRRKSKNSILLYRSNFFLDFHISPLFALGNLNRNICVPRVRENKQAIDANEKHPKTAEQLIEIVWSLSTRGAILTSFATWVKINDKFRTVFNILTKYVCFFLLSS